MPFPTTSILESGVSADVNPIPTFTDSPDGTLYGGLQILSNKIAPVTTDAWSYWNVSAFGPNCEAYRTCDVSTSQHTIDILESIGAGVNGYTFSCTGGSTSASISRIDANVNTQLGAALTLPNALSDGDSIGIQRVAGSINAWFKPSAGAWALVGSRADATYASSSSRIAIYMSNVAGRTSNFGGGTFVAPKSSAASTHVPTSISGHRRRLRR